MTYSSKRLNIKAVEIEEQVLFVGLFYLLNHRKKFKLVKDSVNQLIDPDSSSLEDEILFTIVIINRGSDPFII